MCAPRPRLSRATGALLAAFGSLAAAGAWAQDAKPAAGQLDAVTVTAERRAANINDVPISISTLRPDMLEALNTSGMDVRLLSARVPSLNIESSFGRAFPRFYIRGLGNPDFDINASQPVSLVYDDVVQENPILKGFPIFDVGQVEVLRGPQGTLFGRNTPAGVVKFDSNKPVRGTEFGFSGSTGTYNTSNLEGFYNTSIGATDALRIAVLWQHRNDWVDNTYAAGPTKSLDGYDDKAIRVQYLLKPTTDFSALFNVHHRDLDGSARLFRANIIKPGSNALIDNFDASKVAYDGVNSQKVRNTGGNIKLAWDLGGGLSLNSITGFEHVTSLSRGDIDGGFGASFLGAGNFGPGFIPFPSESADGLPKHKQITQEVRLQSDAKGPLHWLAGVYLFREDLTIDSFSFDSLSPGNPQNGFAQQTQKNTATALFGSVDYLLASATTLKAGLRFTRDEKDYSVTRYQSPIGGTALGPITANPSASDVSWDLSVTQALAKDTNVYARVARGFRAPSIQGRILFGDTISIAQKETVLSSEVGVKSDLLDRRLRVGFDVFQYRVKNQQLTAVGGAANFNQLVNADKTVGQGFELDLQAVPIDRLRLSVGASYNKTEIKDAGLSIQPCSSGCTVLDPSAGGGRVSINGNPLPQAPKWVFNATARYGMQVGAGEVYVFTDWAYRGSTSFFLYESVEYTGRPLLEGGLRVGYAWQEGKYEVALFGRNITNQIRAVGGIDFNNLTGFINEPRLWGVQFKATL